MNLKNGQITVGELMGHPNARVMVLREFPMLQERALRMAWNMSLNQVANLAGSFGVPGNRIQILLGRLKELPEREN